MDNGNGTITRRGFVKSVAAAALGAGMNTEASASVSAEGAETPERRPNVLVVFTNQQRWDTVGAYGSPMGLTPHPDAMAEEGVRFENAFTCQPLCSPARGLLQTGKYATAHGVWRNGLLLPPENKTVAHYFRGHGYRVGYIGKWHLAATRANKEGVLSTGLQDRQDLRSCSCCPHILFADPWEQVNLIGRRDYRKVADQLKVPLIQRMVAAGEKPPKIIPGRFYE